MKRNNLPSHEYLDCGGYYQLIIHSKKHGVNIAYIDKDDYKLVSQYRWSLSIIRGIPKYLQSNSNGNHIRLHTLLVGKLMVDHKNNNGLDNRRENLRIANQCQNRINTPKRSNNSTGYKGVYIANKNRKTVNAKSFWCYICINKKRVGGGLFKTAKEAAIKYNELALQYHGEFANLNIIQ